jgi:hypothetical protein
MQAEGETDALKRGILRNILCVEHLHMRCAVRTHRYTQSLKFVTRKQ